MSSYVVVAPLLLMSSGAFAFGQNVADAAQSISSALRSARYDQALDLSIRALRITPDDPRILTLKALAFSGLGNERDALAAFEHALRISPDYVAALEGAAQIRYKAGSDAAIPLLDRLLTLRPKEPAAHAMRAVMAWKHRDCETAVQHFSESESLISSQPAALYEYGVCLARVKRSDDAISVLKRLVALEPAARQPRYTLAAVYVAARREREALSLLETQIDSPDAGAAVLDLAADAHEALGETPQAVALLRRAIDLSPRDPDLYIHFASLCLAHKSFDVGIDLIGAGLKLIPGSAPLYVARGVLFVQLAQYDKADADFAAAERLDPKQTGSASARALARFQQDHPEQALAAVESQLRSKGNDPFLYYVKAEILSRRGATPGSPEFQQAVAAANRAIELKPAFPLARDVLSRLYMESGEFDRAIEQCRLALRDDSSDATALYRLIRALQKSGRPQARSEVAALLKRFSELRAELQKKEAEEDRFRLVEGGATTSALNQ